MTPLLVHRPYWTQYEWGHSHHAPGLVCRATTSCYIVQANYYECEFATSAQTHIHSSWLALKWQSLQRQHKLGKQLLCQDLQGELVGVLRIYLQVRRCFWTHVVPLTCCCHCCVMLHMHRQSCVGHVKLQHRWWKHHVGVRYLDVRSTSPLSL